MKKYIATAKSTIKELLTKSPTSRDELGELWKHLSQALFVAFGIFARLFVIATAFVSIPFLAYFAVKAYERDEELRAENEWWYD